MRLTDAEFDLCIRLILNKNKDGLKKIFESYGKLIYQQMLSVVKSPQDAEDLTSDFFLRLWETADKYKTGSGHKRYITVIARNMAIDHLRKNGRLSYTIDDDETFHEQQADDTSVDDQVIGDISFSQALGFLKEGEREIINMHLGLEMTFREISEALGRPLSTVTWKYRNALEKLRNFVKEGSIHG